MHYRVLGELRVLSAQGELPLRPGRSRAVLLWLLLARGDAVPAEVLQDRLWEDGEIPDNPQNALQMQISYLRRVFAAAHERPLVTRGGGYALQFEEDDVDAFRFERLVAEARRAVDHGGSSRLQRAGEVLEEALALWRGEPLVELQGRAEVVGEITRLTEMRLAARELAAQVALALGRYDWALTDLRALVVEHPLRERLYELLMVALYRSGRQGEALQAYQQVRTTLIDELGIEPGPALAALEQRVLNQDPSLLGADEQLVPAARHPADEGSRAAPDAAGSSLPAEEAVLVGRDGEVGVVAALLVDHRVVTLTGPGGVGKTRVALAVAHRPGGTPVWFVDLSHVESDDGVAAAVAGVLGVVTRPDVDPLDALGADEPRAGLLLLDTCERVVDGVAALVDRLVGAWPELRVLATSRRPLHATTEAIRPVPPLALPEGDGRPAEEAASSPAVELFLRRAADVRPDLDLTGSAIADVVALCRALDGLPLAIELAAAQSDALSPAAIRRHLSERFDLLVTESRGVEGRHRGLRTTIDWSVALLSADQRRFFGQLAVFPSTFDVAAAAYATGVGQGQAIRQLAMLVRNSLVRPAPDDRFVLLDSLREYAADMSATDLERTEVSRRHADYFATLSAEAERHVRSPEQGTWWERFRAEMPNFRAAMEWSFSAGDAALGARTASALTWVLVHDGRLGEADRWLQQAAAVEGLDDAVRAQVLVHVAMLSNGVGRFGAARRAAATAADLARSAGDPLTTGQALTEGGTAEWALGDLTAAARTHDEAIDVLGKTGETWGAAFAMLLRARTAIDAGESGAPDLAGRAVRACQATGDRTLAGVALQQVSLLALVRGDLDEAARTAEESLVLVESLAYHEGVAAALHLRGRVALARGRPGEAYTSFRATLASGQAMGHAAITCEALEALAATLAAAGGSAQPRGLLDLASRLRELHQLPSRRVDAREIAGLRERLLAAPAVEPARTYLTVADAIVDLPDEVVIVSAPPSPSDRSPSDRGLLSITEGV